jgi:hypothetical protein
MPAARFKGRNGRSYPDTPAGRLNESKDNSHNALRRRGHRMSWRRDGGRVTPQNSDQVCWAGTCRRCPLSMRIGLTWYSHRDARGRDWYPERCPGQEGA